MFIKKIVALWIASCLLLTGCARPQTASNEDTLPADPATSEMTESTQAAEPSEEAEHTAPGSEAQDDAPHMIYPLPDTTMENLSDATLSVSLEEGHAYVDDSGIMRMDLQIYTYDKYDMADIAGLEIGDILVTHAGEVPVISKEQHETGMVCINGGLDHGGLDLVTDDCGIFYERGFNDVKNWYRIGEATIRVSTDFQGSDNADLEQGEVILYPGDFLIGAVTNYDFTPYNTTIRVQAGQIVEMHRVYTP